MQSAYQITWMLLILFAVPEVFDRYKIRTKCEAFNHNGLLEPDHDAFCDHKDVTSLQATGASLDGISISDICRAMFPVGADNCPDLKGPSLESAETWVLPGNRTCQNGISCEELLDAGEKVGPPHTLHRSPRYKAGISVTPCTSRGSARSKPQLLRKCPIVCVALNRCAMTH